MNEYRIITNFITIVIIVSVFFFFILPAILDYWQITNNEKEFGESLTDYDLDKKNECRSFCEDDDVRYIPSTLFKQDVCQCKPKEPR